MGPYLIEALKSSLMRLYGKQVQMGIGGIFKNHEGNANKGHEDKTSLGATPSLLKANRC